MKYFYDEIELADIQNVEAMLQAKLKYIKTNSPYATYEINRIETALDVVGDLYFDLDDEEGN